MISWSGINRSTASNRTDNPVDACATFSPYAYVCRMSPRSRNESSDSIVPFFTRIAVQTYRMTGWPGPGCRA